MAVKVEKQEAMFRLIESWKNSGQSQQEFCKSACVRYGDFHYWYRKYRTLYQKEADSSFISINVPAQSSATLIAELILPNGRRINFYQAVDASFLRSLLD